VGTNGEAAGKWVAARLSNGGTDGVLYDTRQDAIRHQLHENLCAYVLVLHGGMGPHEAEVFLKWNRALYDAGYRMPDPEREAVMPQTAEHLRQLGVIVP
jgi:hypothetical protein